MSKPVIVISAGRQNLHTPRRETQAIFTGCNVEYVKAVIRAGGAPVLLPYLADKESIASVLESANGVLLSGGGDILSLRYGEEPHPRSLYQDPIRDEMEIELTRLAIERNMPVLGICRGIQLVNVALGGTLIQDIPTQVPNTVKHYSEGLAPVLLHSLEIEPESLLARVLETTSTAVNSYHHQAVRDIGAGLRVSARASDSVIEAIESSDGKPILAIQCHPEEIAAPYPIFQKLFDWLVAQCNIKALQVP